MFLRIQKKQVLRFSVVILLLFLFVKPCHSEGWYICCGSYRNLSYAMEAAKTIKRAGIDVFINTYNVENENLYRILLRPSYDNVNQAYREIKKIQECPVAKRLNLKDLWSCKGDPIFKKKATPIPVPAESVCGSL